MSPLSSVMLKFISRPAGPWLPEVTSETATVTASADGITRTVSAKASYNMRMAMPLQFRVIRNGDRVAIAHVSVSVSIQAPT